MSKVAVYTIAKNEEQFVHRWYESAKNADYLIILDTGSTDKTVEIAESLGIVVKSHIFDPWRFDDARNMALSLVPKDSDYCVALDMDEVLIGDFRGELEKALSDNVTRPRYQYTWSWKSEGVPGLQYGGDKVHARHNYKWKHPVHEVVICEQQETQGWYSFEIHHFPDHTKSRAQYFPLLELAVQEDPDDDRNTYYLAREYFFHNMIEKAVEKFKKHLSLPSAKWEPERAASMRYLAKCEPDNAEKWLLRAAAEAPNRREAWVDLAKLYYQKEEWESCYFATKKALQITDKPLEYLCEEESWEFLPYDLAAISSFYLGLFEKAKVYGEIAISLNPKEKRLEQNMSFYLEKYKE